MAQQSNYDSTVWQNKDGVSSRLYKYDYVENNNHLDVSTDGKGKSQGYSRRQNSASDV